MEQNNAAIEQVRRREKEAELRESNYERVLRRQVDLEREEKCASLRRQIFDRLKAITALINTTESDDNDWYKRGTLKHFPNESFTPKEKPKKTGKRRKPNPLSVLSLERQYDAAVAEAEEKIEEEVIVPRNITYATLTLVEGATKVLLRSDGELFEQIHKKCIPFGEKLTTGGDLQSKDQAFLEDLLHRLDSVASNEHLPVYVPKQ